MPDISAIDWIQVRAPTGGNVLSAVVDLGRGEAEVIALGFSGDVIMSYSFHTFVTRCYTLRDVFFLIFTLSLSTAALGQPSKALTPELRAAIERIEEWTALELAKENLGSVTIGIVSDSDLIWSQSYGWADMEKKVMATQDSVYRIGSITKQFTGFMLLQLAERGKIRLSDPVEKYFPEVNEVQGRIEGAPPLL